MRKWSYEIDEKTSDFLTQLQPMFGVNNNSEVLRKLMALGSIVNRFYDRETGTIIVTMNKDVDSKYHTIHLNK